MTEESSQPYKEKKATVLTFAGILVFAVLVFVASLLAAPSYFPEGQMHEVSEGQSLGEIADNLEEKGFVRSSFIFEVVVRLAGRDGGVKSGQYLFERKTSTLEVARRLVNASYGLDLVRITIPEGSSRSQMSEIFASHLEQFDEEKFIDVTEGKEGYLFPDTYLFLPNTPEAEIALHLEETFYEKANQIEDELISSGRTLEEVVIMASIIEKEVSKREDQLLVSGVLWKRLEIGMALQVDAPFLFFLGKGSAELTLEDLKIDSPYNTYVNTGLPPGPIGSPGLGAISAALNPTETEYLFYLSDAGGVTHFAETFEEHKRNKALYLGG